MSRIGEELAKITEGVGGTPTGTSDAALEIKRIIKALDPDASTDGGTFESIVKIRELVEDGKGGGSNVKAKTLNIVNNSNKNIVFSNCIVDGYWNEKTVNAGETAAVQYITPTAEGGDGPMGPMPFNITIEGDLGNVNVNTPEGITYIHNSMGTGMSIVASAADGATVTFTSGVA